MDIATVLSLLLQHADVISLIVEALEGGTAKSALVRAIKAEMVNASDAEMRKELG